jgi:hypothetical protein
MTIRVRLRVRRLQQTRIEMKARLEDILCKEIPHARQTYSIQARPVDWLRAVVNIVLVHATATAWRLGAF